MQANISELFFKSILIFIRFSFYCNYAWLKVKSGSFQIWMEICASLMNQINFSLKRKRFANCCSARMKVIRESCVNCSWFCSPHDICSILKDSRFLRRLHIRRHLRHHRWYLEIRKYWCWPLWSSDRRCSSFFHFFYFFFQRKFEHSELFSRLGSWGKVDCWKSEWSKFNVTWSNDTFSPYTADKVGRSLHFFA